MDSTNKFRKCDRDDCFKYTLEYVNVLLAHGDIDSQLANVIRKDMIEFILVNKDNFTTSQQELLGRYIHENAIYGKILHETDDQFAPTKPLRDLFDFSGVKEIISYEEKQEYTRSYDGWLSGLSVYANLLHKKPSRRDILEDFSEFLVETKVWADTGDLCQELREKVLLMESEGIISAGTHMKILPPCGSIWYLSELKDNIEKELGQLNVPIESKSTSHIIIVVDDDIDLLEILHDTFPNTGYDCWSAGNLGVQPADYLIVNPQYSNTQDFIDRLVRLMPEMKNGGTILYWGDRDLGASSIPLDRAMERSRVRLRRISTLEDIVSIIKSK